MILKIFGLCLLIFLFLFGCTEMQNSLKAPSDTVNSVHFQDIVVKSLPSDKNNYKTVKIEFNLQNVGNEEVKDRFYYKLETDKEYVYEPVYFDNQQPIGLLPEDSKNGFISFEILKNDQAKYLLVYDGSTSLAKEAQAIKTGQEIQKELFGKISLKEFVTPIGKCRFDEECESGVCWEDKKECKPLWWCDKNTECNESKEYCNLNTHKCSNLTEIYGSKYCIDLSGRAIATFSDEFVVTNVSDFTWKEARLHVNPSDMEVAGGTLIQHDIDPFGYSQRKDIPPGETLSSEVTGLPEDFEAYIQGKNFEFITLHCHNGED